MTSGNLTLAPRRSCRLILTAVSLLLTAAPTVPVAMAADNVWVGNASNGNFTDNANWSSPPSFGFGNSLKFNTNTNAPVLNADYGNWLDNNDIFWDSTFPVARTLQSTGNGLGFKQRLENQSSFTQTVTLPLSGGLNGAGGIEINPVNGSLILSGQLYNDNSVDYTVYGSLSGTLTNLTLNTALGPNATQANVDFTVAGGRNTAVQVNASQLWGGTTSVGSGSFTTGTGVTLASSAIVVAGGTVTTTSANTFADTATVTVTSGRLEIGGNDAVASLAGTGGTVDVASGATLTFGGSGSTSYAGSLAGSGNLTKVGSGTFTLTSASSLTGTATVTAGSVVVTNNLAASAVNVSGGSLQLNAANLLADTAAITMSGGTLAFAAGDTIGSLAGTGGTIANTSTSGNYITVQQNVNTTYAGNVSGTYGVVLSGSGRLTLTGSVSYFRVDGGTVVLDGISQAGSVMSLLTQPIPPVLAGTGTMQGTAYLFGIHSPGPGDGGPGTQTFGSSAVAVAYADGSIINWDLIANTTSNAGTNYDQVVIDRGSLQFPIGSGTAGLNLSFNGAGSSVDWADPFWGSDHSWIVFKHNTANSTTNLQNLVLAGGSYLDSLGNPLSGSRGAFSLGSGGFNGNNVVLTYVAVPEPAAGVLAVIGIGLAAALRRRTGRAGRRAA